MTRFNPLDYPIVFQYPLRNSPITDWWGHVPFASMIVDAVRPKLFVELGVFRGDSFSAFCQAVQTLSLDTKCIGIDAWIGDENTGPQLEENITELFEFVKARYTPFAELRKSYFDDEVGSFAPSSIDLLHIDGCHQTTAVWNDFNSWLPKLAPLGVMLFHDIAIGGSHAVGVDIVWTELKARYPGAWFEFSHSWGLGVLAPLGVPPSLSDFFASTSDPEEEAKIQTYFQLLGARNFVSMLYRRTAGDGPMLEGLSDNSLVSDPSPNDTSAVYTFDK